MTLTFNTVSAAVESADRRLIECAACNGERGHAVAYGVNYRDGSWLEYWVPCEWCKGTGEEWIEAKLITEDDVFAGAAP